MDEELRKRLNQSKITKQQPVKQLPKPALSKPIANQQNDKVAKVSLVTI
jgi:hypothetical protein